MSRKILDHEIRAPMPWVVPATTLLVVGALAWVLASRSFAPPSRVPKGAVAKADNGRSIPGPAAGIVLSAFRPGLVPEMASLPPMASATTAHANGLITDGEWLEVPELDESLQAPAVAAPPDESLSLNQDQRVQYVRIGEAFLAASADPTREARAVGRHWNQTVSRSDDQLRMFMGDEVFAHQQLKAAATPPTFPSH